MLTTSRQRGLTLIELMIGLVLGLLVIAMVSALFLNTTRSYRQDERVSVLNDELRLAVSELTSEFEMAGFWGTMIDPQLILRAMPSSPTVDTLANVQDCGVNPNRFLRFTEAIDGLNSAAPAAIATRYPCITSAEVYGGINGAGTGAVKINRVAGTSLTRAALNARRQANNEAPRMFLQTLSTEGGAFVSPVNRSSDISAPLDSQCASATGDPCRYWEMRSSIYYIRAHTILADNDGIPCLTRKRLQWSSGQLRPVSECLVSGVEDLHVEYGVDPAGNGHAAFYTGSPSADDLPRVVAVRVHLLIRSVEPDSSYRNLKTYQLGDKTVTPGEDRFYRRVGTLAVPFRNVTAQRTFQ